MPRNVVSRRRTAFTLVELLIVVGIIAILVSILLPTLSRARDLARNVHCASQVRQIFLATQSYAIDNDGYLPYGVQASKINDPAHPPAWGLVSVGVADFTKGTLWPYLAADVPTRKQILSCPTDLADQAHNNLKVLNVDRNFSYSLNKQVDTYYPLQIARIKNPAQKILVFEERAPNDGACEAVWNGNKNGFNPEDEPASRHARGNSSSVTQLGTKVNSVGTNSTGGRGNHAFCDGHVESIPADALIANNQPYCDLLK